MDCRGGLCLVLTIAQSRRSVVLAVGAVGMRWAPDIAGFGCVYAEPHGDMSPEMRSSWRQQSRPR